MKKVIALAGAIMAMLLLHSVPAYAADLEQVTENMVLETSEEAIMYESPSENSAVIATLEQGTAVITGAAAENGWCAVTAKELTGYVKLEKLKSIGDKAALEEEFQIQADNNAMLMNELERLRSQRLQTRIWGSIIVILVAAMFGVGIYSARKKNKEEANRQSNAEQDNEEDEEQNSRAQEEVLEQSGSSEEQDAEKAPEQSSEKNDRQSIEKTAEQNNDESVGEAAGKNIEEGIKQGDKEDTPQDGKENVEQ